MPGYSFAGSTPSIKTARDTAVPTATDARDAERWAQSMMARVSAGWAMDALELRRRSLGDAIWTDTELAKAA